MASAPIYLCPRIHNPLAINALTRDTQWDMAPAVYLMDAITGAPGRFATEVRALYDDTFLYVTFDCEDDYVWGTVTEREGPIWEEECVEIFINPANAPHQYYEINISPKGTIFDACILNPRTPTQRDLAFTGLPEWDVVDLQTSVAIRGEADQPGQAESWRAVFAIPHVALIGAPNYPPQPGDAWRINFYRIDSPEKGQRDHYAWSAPGIAAFHRPWDFGVLQFE